MGNWDGLPTELRLKVFEDLADEARRSKNMQQYRRTDYAVVCRQWQEYFEPLNFRQLILSNACVSELNRRVSSDKRLMVQRIWLRIEVNEYPCMACHDDFPSQRELMDQPLDLVVDVSPSLALAFVGFRGTYDRGLTDVLCYRTTRFSP